jgi:cytidylate kinase
MPIITISRGSYSFGKETAEKLSKKLGYECISREILLEASEQFHVPEIKLVNAIHDSFGFLDRFTHGKEKYIAYIRASLLKHLQKDNMIYHGLAGHFFLKEISHVLKVRIIADLDSRIDILKKRDHVSKENALHILKKDDEERRKWGQSLYGIDTQSAKLYDMVIHIHKLTVDDAVEIISHAVKRPPFQTTKESQQKLNDLTLEAQVEAALVNEFPTIRVSVKNGDAVIHVKGPIEEVKEISVQIEATIKEMKEIKSLQINISPFTLDVKY